VSFLPQTLELHYTKLEKHLNGKTIIPGVDLEFIMGGKSVWRLKIIDSKSQKQPSCETGGARWFGSVPVKSTVADKQPEEERRCLFSVDGLFCHRLGSCWRRHKHVAGGVWDLGRKKLRARFYLRFSRVLFNCGTVRVVKVACIPTPYWREGLCA